MCGSNPTACATLNTNHNIMENTIVKEIHSSFSTAQEQLLKHAEQILEAAGNEDALKAGVKLKSLGFHQTQNVKALSDEEQERAAEMKELLEVYQKIAPQYKFITDRKRIEICKKYGLVMASVERFTGEIPEKNVQDIINFQILDEKYLKEKDPLTWKRTPIPEMSTRHLKNVINYFHRDHRIMENSGEMQHIFHGFIRELAKRDELEIRDHDDPGLYGGCDKWFRSKGSRVDFNSRILEDEDVVPSMYIVSDIGQLDENKAALDEEKMYLSEKLFWENKWEEDQQRRQLMMQEDPIVLAEVKGGFLVVTAWGGPEASDPDIKSERRN